MILNFEETRMIMICVDFDESPSTGVEIIVNGTNQIKLTASAGNILCPVRFTSLETFKHEKSKLTGMNEMSSTIKLSKSYGLDEKNDVFDKIKTIVLGCANLSSNQQLDREDDCSRFSGITLKNKCLVLVTIELITGKDEWKIRTTVNCEIMVLGSILTKNIKDEFVKKL